MKGSGCVSIKESKDSHFGYKKEILLLIKLDIEGQSKGWARDRRGRERGFFAGGQKKV